MSLTFAERFELIRKLGEGGMGIVHEAHDRAKDMRVAIKKLRYADAWSIERFKRESRAFSDLSHPNILTIYELFNEGDEWYLVMELIDGIDFRQHVQVGGPRPRARFSSPSFQMPGPRNAAEVVSLDRLKDALRQLASALHALHSVDIVHRDLKPENVLVSRDGRVVLMDFGIIAEMRRPKTKPTDEISPGTPQYMAPEQFTGSPASTSADWYAFGVLLYESLTGRPPHFGKNPVTLMDLKLNTEPEPVGNLVSGIPARLEDLCMRLLAREAADRAGYNDVASALGIEQVHSSAAISLLAESDVFVGRAAELAELGRAYSETRAEKARCVFVEGPSGIGKSALLDSFIAGLSDTENRPLVLSSRCHENESLAYKAFDNALDELANHLAGIPRRRRAALLPPKAKAITQLFPTLKQLPELRVRGFRRQAAIAAREPAIAGLEEMFARLAQKQPLVLRIEDLHWADQASLELLQQLLAPPAPAGMLVVATIRTAGPNDGHEQSLAALIESLTESGVGSRIRLGPLGAEDQDEMRQRLVEQGLELDHITDDLWHEIGGYPMLLAELAHYAQSRPRALGSPAAFQLKDVIGQRVSQLPEKARAMLELVAVAGEPTRIHALGEAAALTSVERERAATELRVMRLIRQIPKTDNDVWIDSYHDKVRESVTETLANGKGPALHGRLAHVLEESGGATAARLGRHFAAADIRPKAATYTVAAAREAAEKLAFDRARELYREALEIIGDNREAELVPLWSRAAVGVAECLRIGGRHDEALAQLELAQPVVDRFDLRHEQAIIHYLRGSVAYVRVDLEGCASEHEKARALAHELKSSRIEAQALAGLGDAAYLRCHMLSAFRYYDQCVSLCQEHEFIDIEIPNLGARGYTLACQNDLRGGLRDCTKAAEKAAELGYGRAESLVRGAWLCEIHLRMGNADAAENDLRHTLSRLSALGFGHFQAGQLSNLARVMMLRGDRDEAERLARESVALARQSKNLGPTGPSCLGALALITSAPSLRDEAMREAETLLAAGSMSHNYLAFYPDAIEVTLATGDFDETLRYAQALEDYIQLEPFPWARFLIERGRALARYGRGERQPELMSTLAGLRDKALDCGLEVAGRALLAAAGQGSDATEC